MATAEQNTNYIILSNQIEEHSKLLEEIVRLLSDMTDNVSDNRALIGTNADLIKRVCETLDTITKEIY
tara:strand:+ start:8988 stop:9191 length:204 start_codon:yes stop_codon:yes gene_type:complete